MSVLITIQVLEDESLLLSVGRPGQIPLTEIHPLADCPLPEPLARMVESLPTAPEPEREPAPESKAEERAEPKVVASETDKATGLKQMSLF